MSEAGHRLRIFSVGIWSAVEGLGLPWTASGHHRTRPVGRLIFASRALRLATTSASTRSCGCAASSPASPADRSQRSNHRADPPALSTLNAAISSRAMVMSVIAAMRVGLTPLTVRLAQITPNDIDALHQRCLPFSNAYLEVGVRPQLPRG
jgi:hypothetical protein